MLINTLLLILLVLILAGVFPSWPYSSGWGYGPSGGVGALVLILVVFSGIEKDLNRL